MRGYGCKKCHFVTPEQFKQRAIMIHGNKYDYSNVIFKNTTTEIVIICNTCHLIFNQKPTKHLIGHGCPFCRHSKGENEIKKILDKYNISYESRKRILMDNRNLELDKYFFQNNQHIGIEFDGRQHFEPVGFGCRDKIKIQILFKGIQERDKLKNDWCFKNNYHLLRISYKTKFDLFEKIIVEFLEQSKQKQGNPFIYFDSFYDKIIIQKYNQL